MQCPRCQHRNPAGAKFCSECGAGLALRCPACGTEVPGAAKFCTECGQALGGGSAAPVTRFASPESYTPKHLAERILTSKDALEGERKQVTVLFADVKGSMELFADRDPEQARKLIDPVLEQMMEAVHRYEGTVNQVMGDGIMALIGAPLAHEDHTVRACYAALRMQAAVKRYAEDVRRREGVLIQIRVGLHAGAVVVRSIGSDLRMDYTAVGQTTHLAARMEQLAAPGSILMTAEALRLAEGYIQIKALGPINVKGLREPLDVYELTGPGPVRTRMQVAAARGLTRFVGRQTELETLGQALKRVAAGHGEVVALVGELGVGKSRLVWEFTHSHRRDGWLMLESGSVSYGKATAYRPVIDLLKSYFHIDDRDDGRRIREKVTGKLFTLDRGLEPCLSPLLALLDVPPDDRQWQALDPPQRRQRTLDSVKRLLLRESQAQPVGLIFEDLHWIDAETQALLDSIVESLPTARALLLVNYRPEYQHAWGSKTYYSQLRIDPLPPENARDLLEALLGNDASVRALTAMLIERTEGNAFFLEESARTLIETNVLIGQRGAYRLAKALPAIDVPPTVQAALAARIDRLPPDDKRLLQTAAVIGKDVPFDLLRAIGDVPEAAINGSLSRLRTSEFLYETNLFPDLEYTFKHALTHEVAYGSLLQERRRVLHARIVDTIEALYGDRVAAHIERLAYHAARGEVWEKAVTYLRQAGTKAASRSAYREAAVYFEQALAALSHLPDSRATIEQAIDLRLSLRTSLRPLGELPRVVEYLREAERLAQTLDDPRRLGWVSVWMSQSFWVTGHAAEARTFGQKAKALAETLQEGPLVVVANMFLGLACLTSGDYPQAEECFSNMMQALEGDLSRERFGTTGFPAVQCRAWLAWALAERGAFAQGIAHGQDGLRIAGEVDDPYSLIIACLGLGMLYSVKGELGQAAALLERGLAVARDWKVTLLLPRVTGILGYIYALSGRVAEGLALLDEGLHVIESMDQGAFQALLVIQHGEACALASRPEDALAFAQRALTLATERGQDGHAAYALRLLGQIAARHDPPDVERSQDYYDQAMRRAEKLGMRPLVAHCHLALGELYRHTAKRSQAQSHLATAATMYGEMDMRFWLEKAEAAIAG